MGVRTIRQPGRCCDGLFSLFSSFTREQSLPDPAAIFDDGVGRAMGSVVAVEERTDQHIGNMIGEIVKRVGQEA